MLRAWVRAVRRRPLVAAGGGAAAFLLGLIFWPVPFLATQAEARVALRPDSSWTGPRAAEALLSPDVLGPASGLPPERLAGFRDLLRVDVEGHVVRVRSTAAFAGTAIERVNAVVQSFAQRAPELLRAEREAELARLKAAIAARAAELAELPAERTDPQAEAAAIRALDAEIERLSAALERGDLGAPPALDTRESDRLAAAVEDARARLSALRDTYPEDWPPVARAAAELEDLRLRRQQALNRETLAARFAPVRKTIDRLRELSEERERRARALAGLPKDVATPSPERRDSLREHLRVLEQRRARLLSEAELPLLERVDPAVRGFGGRSTFPLLLVLALAVAVASAVVAERMTAEIRTEHDVRRTVNLPLLGLIPKAADPADVLVMHAPASPLVEPFNTAAALLEGRAAESSAKLIGVTSARAGEGKSTSAANLAVALARGLARVLLIDADLRRPSQHAHFDLGEAQGLSSYLSGAANALDAVLAATELENLTVLPAGAPLQNPIPFLRSERLRVVLPELKERFDFVIVDLPPVRAAADALVLAPTLDGLVLVLAAGETGKDDAEAAKRLIRDARGKLLGCVLNKTEIYSRGYYSYTPEPTPA